MLSLRSVGHMAAMAGREMPGSVFSTKRAMAISAPVLPAETAASASPRAHGIDRQPHAALAAALAQRLAGLGVHGDEDFGVEDLGAVLELRVALQQGRDAAAVAHQQEAQLRVAHGGQGRARNHHLGAGIATHRIQRDGQMSFLVQGLAANRTCCPPARPNRADA